MYANPNPIPTPNLNTCYSESSCGNRYDTDYRLQILMVTVIRATKRRPLFIYKKWYGPLNYSRDEREGKRSLASRRDYGGTYFCIFGK